METPTPPAAVRQAVANWTDIGGFKRKPIQPGETSYIFDWGVRVEFVEDGETKIGYICPADDHCRRSPKADNLLILSKGKTSPATRHLRQVHKLESSKTTKEVAVKRKRDQEIERLRSSTLYTSNPARLNLLLETVRIINHNLPLRLVEYDETRLKEALVVNEAMRTTLNTRKIEEAIIELYASTRKEITDYLDSNRQPYPCFTMVADFWTCKTTSDKFLGLRVYLIDNDWVFKSVLLGTREFKPSYCDRDGGIQRPFMSWLKRTLEDFGLTTQHFYGGTSDKGPDVQYLMNEKLHLQWEWCMAHMLHAVTKAACGLTKGGSASKNPAMSDLVTRMSRTIYQVKHVEVTGDLFKQLCKSMTTGKATTLLSYTDARFLSVTNAIRRVLDLWGPVVAWFKERAKKATRDKKPPVVFPLADHHDDLVQVMSVLQSIGSLKRVCQEEGPTQVNALMQLYKIRLADLDLEKPVLHYLSTPKNPRWILPNELTPLAASTRRLLQEALDKRFFCRYYDESKMAAASFVFEMQQKLHPIFKRPRLNLNAVVIAVCRQHGDSGQTALTKRDKVHQRIRDQLRCLLEKVAEPADIAEPPPPESIYYNELEEMFAPPPTRPQPTVNRLGRRIDEELDRWMDDPVQCERSSSGKPESVLSFWRRIQHEGTYQLLPKAAKVLFAIPTSSCQIERDFSVSGSMVTAQRTCLSEENIDMCSFLNRNQEFVDLLQCAPIPSGKHQDHVPSCFKYRLDVDMDMAMDDVMDDMLAHFVSSASLYEEQKEEA